MYVFSKQIKKFTLCRGDTEGGDSLTTSTALRLATRNKGSPFSLCPPPTINGAVPNRSVVSLAGTRGGGTGGEENTSSGDWRRF